MTLLDAPRVHFIGVGGAGMSAIAKVLVERGVPVSGSDLKRSRAATVLEAMGATLRLDGHDPALVRPGDVVVVSSAIPPGNPELRAAEELGCRVLTRGEALAELLHGSRSVVVAGTHGKTTTTSMIVTVLRVAGADPTYLVGGGLNESGTNARSGRDPIAVAESDESDGSFLLLSPHVGVVTNVEPDHLDHYASADEVRAAFVSFVRGCDPSGTVTLPADEPELRAAAPGGVLTFGPGGDVAAHDVRLGPGGSRFILATPSGSAEASLAVPGAHNVSDALAAAGACLAVGIEPGTIAAGLARYRGVERRFQVRGTRAGVTVVDDYAHHPSEVRATLEAARSLRPRRLVAVFQPHRYSRTAALGRAFGPSFAAADVVVITDVYGAGEDPLPGVNGKVVADAVCEALPGRAVAYLPQRWDLLGYLRRCVRAGDLVVVMGAGDITTAGEELLRSLEEAA